MADLFVRKVLITPEMASGLLSKNTHNRTISKVKVTQMVNDIKSGRFETTHQPVAIAEDGELIDGQHRLTAIVESGIAVELLVAYNAPRSTKIDIGKIRDARTSLYMAGIVEKASKEYGKSTYPLVRMIVAENFGVKAANLLTADELHAIYYNHSKDIDTITDLLLSASKTGVPSRSSVLVYCMLCAYKAGCPLETITNWYKIACTGEYADETSFEKTKAGQSIMLYINYARFKRVDFHSPEDRLIEFIKKTMSSIRHFERGDTISKLYGERCYPEYTISPDDFYLDKIKQEVV